MVRHDIPSARPNNSGPGAISVMQVQISSNSDICRAIVRPAGPVPIINTSTSLGNSSIFGAGYGFLAASGI